MKRLLTTVHQDVQLQFRNGFYYATAFIVAIWVILFSQLLPERSRHNLQWLLPAIILDSLLINTFYFVSGLVLLEKGEGTLHAQVVTPLRTWEYLSAKVITLTLLALIQNLIIVGLFYDLGLNILPLAVGIVLASAIYVLAGFVAVARYDSINEYLLPSGLYAAMLLLPLLPYVSQWDNWLIYLHPLQGALVVMQAAFQPVKIWQVIYGVLYSGLWIGLVYLGSRRAFLRFVIARSGGA